jgi:hypothetical protein
MISILDIGKSPEVETLSHNSPYRRYQRSNNSLIIRCGLWVLDQSQPTAKAPVLFRGSGELVYMEFTPTWRPDYGNRVSLTKDFGKGLQSVDLIGSNNVQTNCHSSTTRPKEEVETRNYWKQSGKQRRGGAVTGYYLTLP